MNFIDLKANISMKEGGMDMEKLRNSKVIIKRENSGTEKGKTYILLKFEMYDEIEVKIYEYYSFERIEKKQYWKII